MKRQYIILISVPKTVQKSVGIRYLGCIITSTDISIERLISVVPSAIMRCLSSEFDIIEGMSDSASCITTNITRKIIIVIIIFSEAVDFFDSSNILHFSFNICTSVKKLYKYYILYFPICQDHGISTSKQIMNKRRLTKWNQENSAQAYT